MHSIAPDRPPLQPPPGQEAPGGRRKNTNFDHLAHLIVAVACCNMDGRLTGSIHHLEQFCGSGEKKTNDTNVPTKASQMEWCVPTWG